MFLVRNRKNKRNNRREKENERNEGRKKKKRKRENAIMDRFAGNAPQKRRQNMEYE